MSPEQAKTTVLVGVLGSGALAAVNDLRQGNVPSARIGVGVLVTGSILLVLAEFAPAIAAGFGALILTTSAFVIGGSAWSAISNVTK